MYSAEIDSTFADLGLCAELLANIEDRGYLSPTPIQREAIPNALTGSDLLATAQTGTGKTASFVLPILETILRSREVGDVDHSEGARQSSRKARGTRALILTPTRELAEQINANIRVYAQDTGIFSTAITGGVPFFAQERALRRQPEIVVATPGRLIDLIGQGKIELNKIEVLVLDEADRMLDMGFSEDVAEISAHMPQAHQTLLFSATMAGAVTKLAQRMLKDPMRIEIAACTHLAKNLQQKFHCLRREDKLVALSDTIKALGKKARVLVFSRTKRQANVLSDHLSSEGIRCDAIHSDKSQGARRRSLKAFDQGRIQALIGTDVVSRGIDVKEIDIVINFDLPEDPEVYVHRIGRTARAASEGIAITFCTASDAGLLKAIHQFAKIEIIPSEDAPHFCEKTWRSISSVLSGAASAGRGRGNSHRQGNKQRQGGRSFASRRPYNQRSSGPRSSGQRSSGPRSSEPRSSQRSFSRGDASEPRSYNREGASGYQGRSADRGASGAERSSSRSGSYRGNSSRRSSGQPGSSEYGASQERSGQRHSGQRHSGQRHSGEGHSGERRSGARSAEQSRGRQWSKPSGKPQSRNASRPAGQRAARR